MAKIIPFKGHRPNAHLVHLVASRSVDNYSKASLYDKLYANPYSFLHVINPDFEDNERTKPGSLERLKKIRARYDAFHQDGIFTQDQEPSYYIYSQLKDGHTFTGIMGCSSIDDYISGEIKVHEQTLTIREEKLKQYLEVCEFNAEPVLFCYPDNAKINEIIAQGQKNTPVYDFTTPDRVRHTLWVVSDAVKVKEIEENFAKIPHVYIADGHHRSASSAILGVAKRKAKPDFTGKEPWNFYLGVFFSDSQLKIYDFNRIVKDLNGQSENTFLARVKEKFDVTEKGETIYKPKHIHNFSMYLSGKWYSLDPKPGIVHNEDPVGSLDASILTEQILSPILNIHDLKTDKRIGFVSGIKGMEELKNQIDNWRSKVAFALYPVSIEQLKQIADTGNIMPPKTTWVEPKMRSGLVIYSLEE